MSAASEQQSEDEFYLDEVRKWADNNQYRFDDTFLTSLEEWYEDKGSLTQKQLEALIKIYNRFEINNDN